ncbi:MAG TPA: luciferase family protein [Candidatus Limnocylindria bacterium]
MTVLDDFMTRGARLRGITVRQSKFRGHGEALWLGKTEVAHCHNGEVDVRLTRAVVRTLRDELRSDARIDLRGPGYDWILVRVRRSADVERALELLRHAVRAARTIAP